MSCFISCSRRKTGKSIHIDANLRQIYILLGIYFYKTYRKIVKGVNVYGFDLITDSDKFIKKNEIFFMQLKSSCLVQCVIKKLF